MNSTDGRATSSSPMLTRFRCPPLQSTQLCEPQRIAAVCAADSTAGMTLPRCLCMEGMLKGMSKCRADLPHVDRPHKGRSYKG